MNYKHLENKIADDEILSGDAKISALLGDLKRVDVPPDFDFRLKARIARAEANDYRPSTFLPVLRYVLPLGLVILVSAFVVFNGVYFADEQSVPQIAEKQSQHPPLEIISDKTDAVISSYANENISPPPAKAETAGIPNSVRIQDRNKQSSANSSFAAAASGRKPKAKIFPDKEDTSGSHTSAFTPETKITTPPGINPNRAVQTSPNPESGKSLTAKEVLSQLGIEAVFTNENWKVKSVVQNSLAERSGVKPGDAVEAIDGERLTDKPLKSRTIEGKNLTIARGREKIEISLNNRQN